MLFDQNVRLKFRLSVASKKGADQRACLKLVTDNLRHALTISDLMRICFGNLGLSLPSMKLSVNVPHLLGRRRSFISRMKFKCSLIGYLCKLAV